MKRCPQCGSQLAKSAPAESAEYCSNCKDQSKNTNRKRAEDRNQSFGGETHSKQPKGNNHNSRLSARGFIAPFR